MTEATFVLNPRWSSLDELVEAQRRAGGLRLDLGSGYFTPEGFVGLDNLSGRRAQGAVDDERGPDLLLDLDREALPFADGSVDEVRSSHFLEHIEHDRLGHVFDEVARVLRPGGEWLIVGPYGNSAEGMFPGHVVFLTEKWFRLNPVFQAHFEIVHERYTPSDDWERLPRLLRRVLPFDLARTYLFNVCKEMAITASRRGDGRT
jgi:SAM-dependent methyltransferase